MKVNLGFILYDLQKKVDFATIKIKYAAWNKLESYLIFCFINQVSHFLYAQEESAPSDFYAQKCMQ